MRIVFSIAIALFLIVEFGFTLKSSDSVIQPEAVYTDTERIQYICLPCGSECDKAIYTKPGTCTHCNMKLVNRESVKFNNIEPGAICSFIKDMGKQNVILLDVRTKEEFNGTAPDKFGRLAGAVNIPVQELDKRMVELNKYKNKEIIVYCSHSHRSPMASYMLMQKGFKKVTNMEFGMSEWKNKVKGNACDNKLYVAQ